MMNKKQQYQSIFDEYQRLKGLYPFYCKTEIIRRMIGGKEKPTKAEIDKYDAILRVHFGVLGDRYQVQELLENEVVKLWQKYERQTGGNVRETARIISGSLNVDFRRVRNILYRLGFFGNFAQSKGAKKVAIRKKTGRKPQNHNKVENDLQEWGRLFRDNIMQFSPAWYGKNQAA